jgi:ribosomal protein S18 acetylase RimI-like enzyme
MVPEAVNYRRATPADARKIAELIALSSDGVAVIEWQQESKQRGHADTLDIGAETYANDEGCYSYTNCTMAEVDNDIAGMLLTFAMPDDCLPRSKKQRPQANDTNVFAPYMYLEEPGSWYICGVAAFKPYRGVGIGQHFMQLAEQQARNNGYQKVSLVAFEQNARVVSWYQRLGYQVVDRAPIVPHPLIPYTDQALLMVKSFT